MNYGQRQITLRKISRCFTSSQKFRYSKFSVKKKLQIDSKWSETRKKHKTADPSVATDEDHRLSRRPISSVEYVNTSYHTTFHQNISINVACIHKRALVPWKCQNGPPPLVKIAVNLSSFAFLINYSTRLDDKLREGAICTLSRNQNSFVDTGHIYW